MIQVLRHLKNFTKCLSKDEIRKSLQYQQDTYGNDSKFGNKSNFRISILLSNVFSNLGLGMPDKALENLKELRKHLAKGFFSNSDQQDAQEFLQALVNKVKEELDQIQGEKQFIENRDIFGDRALEMEVS